MPKQMTSASRAYLEEEGNASREVSRGDGGGGSVVTAAGADRAALPEDGPQGRPACDAAGGDAADLLPAVMVRAERSTGGGKLL